MLRILLDTADPKGRDEVLPRPPSLCREKSASIFKHYSREPTISPQCVNGMSNVRWSSLEARRAKPGV